LGRNDHLLPLPGQTAPALGLDRQSARACRMADQYSPDAVPPCPPPAPIGSVAGRLPPSQRQAHAVVPDGHHAAVALASRSAPGGQAALHHVRGGLLVQEAGNGYDAVNTWVQSGGVTRLPDELGKLPLLGGRRVQHMLHKLVGSKAHVEAFLLQSAKAMSGFIVEQVTGLVKNAFLLTVNFLVIVIALFFFFKDGKRLFLSVYRGIPLDKAHKDRMFSRLDQTITAVVKGIVITAIVQGVLAGLAYAVLDVPFPAFLT